MNRISQYLVYPIVRFFSCIFLKVEFKNPEGLRPIVGKPAVIVANHISFYDSFLLRLNGESVGLSLYFMGVKSFNSPHMRFLWTIGIVPLVYKLFGVFLVYPGQGLQKNLEAPKQLLAQGNQVFIFPEGSVNDSGTLKPFKKGAAALAVAMNAPVLPIAFKEESSTGRRKKVVITIGQPMQFPAGTSVETANAEMEARMKEMLA